MLSGKIYSVAVLSCMMVGCFICSPVFAENPAEISIIEVVDDGSGGYKAWEDIVDAMPGVTYSMIVRARNDGVMSARVRMCLSESATSATGEAVVLSVNAFEVNINDHWVLDNEDAGTTDSVMKRCYKYVSVLDAGAMTEPLFTEVALNTALQNEYQGATFGLHLDADATSLDPGDGPVEPSPDSDGSTPGSPDTGVNGSEGVTAAIVIPYALGVAALVVLVIHLLRNLLIRK